MPTLVLAYRSLRSVVSGQKDEPESSEVRVNPNTLAAQLAARLEGTGACRERAPPDRKHHRTTDAEHQAPLGAQHGGGGGGLGGPRHRVRTAGADGSTIATGTYHAGDRVVSVMGGVRRSKAAGLVGA